MPEAVHRVPGLVLTDHRFAVPLIHDRPDGEQLERLRSRGRSDREDRRRPALAAVPAGRARPRGAAAGHAIWMAGPRGAGIPGPPARPARHRALVTGHAAVPGPARGSGRAGRVPRALPGRRDRGRRRTDPAPGHRRYAVERARPELRRVLPAALPVGGRRRRAGGVPHRRARAAGGHRRGRVPGDVPAGACEERRLLRAVPGRRRAGAPDRRPPREPRRAPARTAAR